MSCDSITPAAVQSDFLQFFTPQLQDLSLYDQVTNNKLETFIFKFSMNPYLCLVSVTLTWNILHYIWLSHLWKYLLLCTTKNVSGADPYLFVKASFCENRLCLLLNQNCFSLSIETLKDIINFILHNSFASLYQIICFLREVMTFMNDD